MGPVICIEHCEVIVLSISLLAYHLTPGLFIFSFSLTHSIVFLFRYFSSNVRRLCNMAVKRDFYSEIRILFFLFNNKIEFGKEGKRD